MTRIQDLPFDVWFLIVEHLNLADLHFANQAFTGMSSHTDVTSLTASQVTKILYQLLTANAADSTIGIKSDLSKWNHSYKPLSYEIFKDRGPFTYLSRMTKLKQNYIPISSSIARITLSATNRFSESFCPERYGGEPLNVISTRVHLHLPITPSPGCLTLHYGVDPQTCETTLDDVQQSSTSLLRTIGQEFHLSRVVWNWIQVISNKRGSRYKQTREVKEQELPLEWFDFLGGKIRVEVTFRKGFQVLPPNDLTPEEWSKASSFLKMTSISFDNVALPTAKSLLQLFPKEITTLQDEESCQSN